MENSFCYDVLLKLTMALYERIINVEMAGRKRNKIRATEYYDHILT